MLEHGRKIATILAADVVGYSRLMGVDDSGALAALKVRRTIFARLVTEFDGREFGSVGDSLMAQFPSAVNAVHCAQAIQQAVATENESLPAEQRMQLRIGLNLGDVIEENDALFGDAVNVAARLQSLAAPGGILISGAVYEHVKKKLPARLEFAGDRHVKNIPEAIATYEVLQADLRWPRLHALLRHPRARVTAASVLFALVAGASAWHWRESITSLLPRTMTAAAAPAIAVLPFVDLSENQSNAPFCDGLTEELLNSLAQLPNLRVVARTSAFMFRDGARDVREIGRQLDVSHVLEGSVRRSGERVRITAQLINARDGYNVWSQNYDQALTDSLDIQRQIAQAVVEAMRVRLSPQDAVRLTEPRAHDAQAYESYLLGRYHQHQRTPESLAKAVEYYRSALARDSRFALAYAGLADTYVASFYYADDTLQDLATKVPPLIERALAIDPNLAEAYIARGTARAELWQLADARADLLRATQLSPNNADAHLRFGTALAYDGRPRAALEEYRRAAELDPLHYALQNRVSMTELSLGRYEQARQAGNRALELRPDLPNAYWVMGMSAYAQGDLAGAARHYRVALEKNPRRTDLWIELGWIYLDRGLLNEARATFDQAVEATPVVQDEARVQKGFWFVAKGDVNGLARYLSALDASTGGLIALHGALLALVAGDVGLARDLADRAGRSSAIEPLFLSSPLPVMWGRSGQLTFALVARSSGDVAGAEKAMTELMSHLDYLEREGHVYHGLEYLRASVLALRGDSTASVSALERAYQLGWRRAWWMRADPAFGSMRRDPAFLELITRIEVENSNALKASKSAQVNDAVRPPIPNAP